jgi:plasmid stabilization system protein ParE
VTVIRWTPRARADLAAIRAFIDQDSPHYAAIVVSRLIAATDRLAVVPESGRAVPEFQNPVVREVILRPYRIVYRLAGDDEIHILTVHHASQSFPAIF